MWAHSRATASQSCNSTACLFSIRSVSGCPPTDPTTASSTGSGHGSATPAESICRAPSRLTNPTCTVLVPNPTREVTRTRDPGPQCADSSSRSRSTPTLSITNNVLVLQSSHRRLSAVPFRRTSNARRSSVLSTRSPSIQITSVYSSRNLVATAHASSVFPTPPNPNRTTYSLFSSRARMSSSSRSRPRYIMSIFGTRELAAFCSEIRRRFGSASPTRVTNRSSISKSSTMYSAIRLPSQMST